MSEGGCHAKTMRSIKTYEAQRSSMCRLRRARRTMYEGRGEKRYGVATTDETRKWDERPRVLITEVFR